MEEKKNDAAEVCSAMEMAVTDTAQEGSLMQEMETPQNGNTMALRTETPQNGNTMAPQTETPQNGNTMALQTETPQNGNTMALQTGAPRNGDMTAQQAENAVEASGCPHCRTKHRETKEYRELMNRLKRIEGQVRGIQGMLQEERYCVDILTQVMAVQSALNSFNKMLLTNHIKTCVVEDIQKGDENAVEELCTTVQRLMR